MDALIARDLRLAGADLSSWLPGLLFFVFFIMVSVIAIGPEARILRDMAGGLIWLALLFSLILKVSDLFQRDMMTGMTEQIFLSGQSKLQFVIAKAVSVFLIHLIPLLIIIPIVGFVLGLEAQQGWAMTLSVLVAAPALIFYVLMTAAILSRQRTGGFIAVIMVLPFLIPILIFGVAAAESADSSSLYSVEIKALLGLNLISMSVGIPAIVAALKANIHQVT
ncbi:MAG: heme exporter protein CcmB [Hyphomonadaceae bacterium]|nr:heme exporter protein CcmB [Hyphomonadaceae bacterium]